MFFFQVPANLLASIIVHGHIDRLAVDVDPTGDDVDVIVIGVVMSVSDPWGVIEPHFFDVLLGDLPPGVIIELVILGQRQRYVGDVFFDAWIRFAHRVPLAFHFAGVSSS